MFYEFALPCQAKSASHPRNDEEARLNSRVNEWQDGTDRRRVIEWLGELLLGAYWFCCFYHHLFSNTPLAADAFAWWGYNNNLGVQEGASLLGCVVKFLIKSNLVLDGERPRRRRKRKL